MKILINTSTLYFGGGVQVSLSFLNELKQQDDEHQYIILLSKEINKQLAQSEFSSKRFKFFLIEKSPAALLSRNSINKLLDNIEYKINPDIVFTIFGPSYWRPKTKHIVGFADGWVYSSNKIVYSKLSFFQQIKMKLLKYYKLYYLNRDADYIIIETKDAKKKLARLVRLSKKNIFVVGNTYSNIFDKSMACLKKNNLFFNLPNKTINEHRLLYISHNHPAKNLSIIKLLVPYIKELNIKFVLTINQESFIKMFKDTSAEKFIINLGPVSLSSCPSIYHQCDYLFAPTLLETFSAAYPEAMKMQKPILTSNYSFAKDVCQDAALYFNPLDPVDISNKIKTLIESKSLQEKLINKGLKRLTQFETAESRTKKYIMICSKIVKKEI